MADLSTQYMGFTLRNPIIVASSGLTRSVEKIVEMEQKGAAAVVLKSLFEEQILHDIHQTLEYPDAYNVNPEALDYVTGSVKENEVAGYVQLIRDAKKAVSIPVFASINCVTLSEWVDIARDMEQAGADGLELNIFIMPGNLEIPGPEHEQMYFDIIDKVTSTLSIPVALKIGYYFSSLVHTLQRFSWTGIKGLVLFNRFFTPDINLTSLKLQPANLYSVPSEQYLPLRWIAMLSDVARCDIAASTGIHDAAAAIRQILAGARAVQICSTLYLHGTDRIAEMVDGISEWMDQHAFAGIEDFRGRLSVNHQANPVLYQRVQYMKYLLGTD